MAHAWEWHMADLGVTAQQPSTSGISPAAVSAHGCTLSCSLGCGRARGVTAPVSHHGRQRALSVPGAWCHWLWSTIQCSLSVASYAVAAGWLLRWTGAGRMAAGTLANLAPHGHWSRRAVESWVSASPAFGPAHEFRPPNATSAAC